MVLDLLHCRNERTHSLMSNHLLRVVSQNLFDSRRFW